jgi:hypothetical protein
MIEFDRFVGVDWSGAKTPVHNHSISVALCGKGDSSPILIKGDRPWSRTEVAGYIDGLVRSNTKTLIGIDANFGYAREIVQKQMGEEATAKNLWHVVDDYNQDNSNFFTDGFWKYKKFSPYFWTSGKQPDDFKMPKRLTEKACAFQGMGHPESPFKFIGAKQVGKGGLAAMRLAHYLKNKHGSVVSIFPFDKITHDTKIVMTEIYPRLFIRHAGFGNKKIRNIIDLNDVLSALHSRNIVTGELSDHDTDALISAAGLRHFYQERPEIFKPKAEDKILQSEGWIFGVR